MEVSALRHRGTALRGPTPLLRLQGDDRLVALTRRGNQAAYEVLVARYEARLLAFCRHMLGSKEDAEDVLQEVFAAAFNAMIADERAINVRPWLYRIARNRSLNHLRRTQAIGVDSMDVHLADHGATTADRVHEREEFRQLVGDVQTLPETQRTALLLREIDALSYEQISEAMDTTVPSVKSLLVRARVSLAEAAEARQLTCAEVREELGEVAEGLKRKSAPVRRHVRGCERCGAFDKQLRQTNRALAAVLPVGPLLFIKKFLLTQAGAGGAAAGSAAAGATAGAGAAGAGSALTAGLATVATKVTAGLTAAAIVTAGAVEVDHARKRPLPRSASAAAATPAPVVQPAPRVVASIPQPLERSTAFTETTRATRATDKRHAAGKDADQGLHAAATGGAVPKPGDAPVVLAPSPVAPGPPQVGSDTSVLPGRVATNPGGVVAPAEPAVTPAPPALPPEQQPAPAQPQPAPDPATTPAAQQPPADQQAAAAAQPPAEQPVAEQPPPPPAEQPQAQQDSAPASPAAP
jgi:RNA polymerase sigma factor (sigma-70 family)